MPFDPRLPTDTLPSMRHFMRPLPVRDLEIVQTGRGVLAPSSLHVFGRDSYLAWVEAGPSFTATVIHDPGWIGLLIPVEWKGDYIYNGHEARPGEVFLRTSATGYSTRSRQRKSLGVSIRREKLLEACAALCGVDRDDVTLRDDILPLAALGGTAFLQQLRPGSLLPAGERPEGSANRMHPAAESRLIDIVAGAVAWASVDGPASGGTEVDSLHIVRSAEDAIRADRSFSLGVADLCAAARVGTTRLHRAFHEIHGLAPYQFMRVLRLTKAREELLDPDSPPRSVKDVAIAHGFSKSGSFAAGYRAVFGELPSETLSRRG